MSKEVENLFEVISAQEIRKSHCINLIASENVISDNVRNLQASLLSNRYVLDDFPNNNGLFDIKDKLHKCLGSMFDVSQVNVSPLSGMNCMELVLGALAEHNSTVYTLKPMDGGHGSTTKICEARKLKVEYLSFDIHSYQFNIKEIANAFERVPPSLIYLDNRIICFYTAIDGLVELSHRYGAPLIYDGSHVLGLIAGKSFPNPILQGADILCGSTHKTFFGPQKGIILSNNQSLIQKINELAVDYISSIHTGSMLALYMSALEMERWGTDYSRKVIHNAKALGKALSQRGVSIPYKERGFTDTHQVWIDTKTVDPSLMYQTLAECNINTNAIRIPAIQKTGLRLGTAEITRLGMTENDMEHIADYIVQGMHGKRPICEIKEDVVSFMKDFQHVHFTLDARLNIDSDSIRLENSTDIIDQQNFSMHEVRGDYHTNDYLVFAERYVADVFKKIPGFLGMIVRGGVGRGTADHFSDIDFTCIFDCEDIDSIKQVYGLKLGMHIYSGIMFSGRYISLKSFSGDIWSSKMKHAYSFVKLICCDSRIEDIIKRKVHISEDDQKKRLVANIIELGEICKVYDCYRKFNMFSEIYKQWHRGEVIAPQMEIDRALRYIKNIIFDLNLIHYPEEKNYYSHFFQKMSIQPRHFDEKIEEILLYPRDATHLNARLSKTILLARDVINFCEQHISLPDDIYGYFMGSSTALSTP